MDAPPDRPSANPSDETHFRPDRQGETYVSNSLELNLSPPWTEGDMIGDFRIGKLLGRGRAGFVYSADDLVARRRCALKVLCRTSSYDLVRNKLGFQRMAPFRHPSLMHTDRIDVIDGLNVLSMEEIDGETLCAAVRRYATGSRAQAYQKLHVLLHDYAVGLAIMHFAGLVHRDIKPTNLMVRKNGHGVIVDYGLVTSLDPETDPYGIRPYIAGTPRYFSPEALWEQSYVPSGDVFSLGLVMMDSLNEISGSDRWLRQGDFDDWNRDEDQRLISDAVLGLDEEIPSVLRMAVAGMLSKNRVKRPSSLDLVELTKGDDSPIRLVSDYHLFGREQELEECNEWIRGIYRGGTGRLHLYGEAGAGKTRLLDEIERLLKQNQWGQVFRVKCRSRENQTMQVMGQIVDQIASRYARGDREPLRLDTVSYEILIQAFPQLRHVLEVDLREQPESFAGAPERLDALTAAVRLSRELRKVGPLIIIIDDAQWSDHDSDSVWDELQSDSQGHLGLITSSRHPETNQRHKPQQRLHIGPLHPDAAFAFLQNAVKRWSANLNDAGLKELVDVSRCNAFRLQELVEEIRPGGMLNRVEQSDDSSISNLGDIDRFWKARFDRLSAGEKAVLAFIVSSEAPVSVLQLSQLTGQENIDASVSKLVEQRLVNDDATGKECITIVHDKIAAGLIENLSAEQLRRAHRSWAKLLSAEPHSRDFVSRVAGHYYSAGDKASALPFAIQAAENADKAYAKAEAGMWHEKVLEQVAAAAREKHLREAARCYHEADLPNKASELYLQLSEETADQKERRGFQILALQLLIRSGNVSAAMPLIEVLSKQLNSHNKLGNDLGNKLVNKLTEEQLRARLAAAADSIGSIDAELASLEIKQTELSQESSKDDPLLQAKLQYCTAMARAMSMLDLRQALKIVVQGSELANECGGKLEQIHFGCLAVVWHAMMAEQESGRNSGGIILDQSRQRLIRLSRQLEQSGNQFEAAEVWAGLSYLEALAMRWSQVPYAVDTSIEKYNSQIEPLRFEIAHTRWLRLWADWQLGRWENMRSVASEMIADAKRRNDTYQYFMATSAYGGNVFLMSDESENHRVSATYSEDLALESDELQFIDFCRWIQGIQRGIYRGEYAAASKRVAEMKSAIEGSLIGKIPLMTVTLDFYTALVALHLQQQFLDKNRHQNESLEAPSTSEQDGHREVANRAISSLRSSQNAYADMLAALMEGIQNRICGNQDQACASLAAAAESASESGLFPFQLAAEDALLNLTQPDAPADSLRQRMTNKRIAKPHQLERLYTVAPTIDD